MGKPLNSTKRSRKRNETIYKERRYNSFKKEERFLKSTENAKGEKQEIRSPERIIEKCKGMVTEDIQKR